MVQKSGDHQLRLVVYPMIYMVLYIPGGCLGSLNHQQYVGMHLKPWRFLIQFFEHIFLDGWQEKTRLVSALSLGMQNSIPRMQSCQNEGYITYPNTQCMVYLGSKKHHALSVCVIYIVWHLLFCYPYFHVQLPKHHPLTKTPPWCSQKIISWQPLGPLLKVKRLVGPTFVKSHDQLKGAVRE